MNGARRGLGCGPGGCLTIFVLLVIFPMTLLTVILGAGNQALCDPGGSGDGGTLDDASEIPAQARIYYKRQADKNNIDVAFLASIGAQESDHGRNAAAKTVNSSGCVGWMQLGVGGDCGDFWGRNKCDGNGDGKLDVMNAEDNICASAKGLRGEKNAPPAGGSYADYRQAACDYYGACSDPSADYANDIMRRAVKYGFPAKTSDGLAPAGDPSTGDTPDDTGTPVTPGSPADGAGDEGTGSTTKLQRPVPANIPVTSPFGARSSPGGVGSTFHEGADFGAPSGTPVKAAADGRVNFSGTMSGYGNYVCITHGPKFQTCYAHLTKSEVQPDDDVKAGQEIAKSGNTGVGTGAHLHFEARKSTKAAQDPAVDPLPLLDGGAPVGDVPTDPNACPAPPGGVPGMTPVSDTDYDWPAGSSGGSATGKVIGVPNQGTHSRSEPPNNWQSDEALDIGMPVGTPLVAVDDGTISPSAGFGDTNEGGRFAGQRFTLTDAHGREWYYAHLSKLTIRPGQRVKKGDPVGSSGSANGVPHLHIGVSTGDPRQLLGVTGTTPPKTSQNTVSR